MTRVFGFPRMWIFPPFRREFPPWLIHELANTPNVEIMVANGYGEDLGFRPEDYKHHKVKFVTQKKIFEQADYIVCLTTPSEEEWKSMNAGQTLLAFLHYNTHPDKTKWFYEHGIHTISLDDIKDERGNRLVEDLRSTAYNSVKAGIIELRKNLGENRWFDPSRDPLRFYVMGTGKVGLWAIRALNHFGFLGYQEELKEKGGNPKTIINPLGRFETSDKKYMNNEVLPQADLLLDATYRPAGKTNKPIITTDQLSLLPKHAVIVDTTADRYDLNSNPPVVKAIQGIPTGWVDKYVFSPNDPEWTDPNVVPAQFQTEQEQRRTVVSSYSWPSYGTPQDRLENTEHYAQQLRPILEFLAIHGVEGIRKPQKGKTSALNDALYRSLNPYAIGTWKV